MTNHFQANGLNGGQKLPISVAIITLNEEKNIARALKSVEWAAEVVIYDSGSTDLTVEIAQKMGAKVTNGAWLGFGSTKHQVTALASHDWILSIDADEEVSPELRNEISAKLMNLNIETAYRLPRLSNFLGRWIRHGGWYPDYQVRLFNRLHAEWNQSNVHEKVEAKNYESLISNLNHYVFKNISHQIQTNDKYSSLLANDLQEKGKKFSWFHFLTKPSVKFIECYIWKLGFLDGWPGYVIARNAAHSVFMKWSKLKELQMLPENKI
ncbi:MAG: glycosyltransferase family 2 protein [Bdellovibrio sp.]|nr:glycosyltransferase family 2 protein [Bdellovibrio sp.]